MSGSSIKITLTGVDRASKMIDQVNARIAAMRAPADRAAKSIAKFGDVTGITALGKGMRSVAQHSLEAFNNVARLAGPLAAITGGSVVAGMASLVSEWARFGQNLDFTAKRTRSSAGDLLQWENAARVAGSSAAAMDSGITTLNDSLVKASQGFASPEVISVFHQLHVELKNADGSVRTVSQALPELVAGLSAIRDPTVRAYDATVLFGGAGEDLLRVFGNGLPAFQHYLDEVARYSKMSPQQIADAKQLAEAQRLLGVAVDDLGRSVAGNLAPYLSPLLADMSQWIGDNKELIGQDVVGAVKEIAGGIKELASEANTVAEKMGGWENVIKGIIALKLAGWASGVVGQFTPLLSLVRGLTGAFPSMAAAASAAQLTAMIALAYEQDQESKRILGQSDQQIRDKYANPEQLGLLGRILRPFGLSSPFGPGARGTGGSVGRVTQTASVAGMTGEERGLLDAIAGGESKSYNDQNLTSSAYGRYQFINSTRKGLLKQMGLPIDTPLTDELQDRMALLDAKNRGWRPGMTPQQSAGVLAPEWASLPGGPQQNTSMDVWTQRLANARAMEEARIQPAGPRLAANPIAGSTMTGADPFLSVGPGGEAVPGIGNGTGSGAAPADSKVTGEAMLKVMFANAPAGMRTSTDARGDLWGAPPKVEQFMPLSPGG